MMRKPLLLGRELLTPALECLTDSSSNAWWLEYPFCRCLQLSKVLRVGEGRLGLGSMVMLVDKTRSISYKTLTLGRRKQHVILVLKDMGTFRILWPDDLLVSNDRRWEANLGVLFGGGHALANNPAKVEAVLDVGRFRKHPHIDVEARQVLMLVGVHPISADLANSMVSVTSVATNFARTTATSYAH